MAGNEKLLLEKVDTLDNVIDSLTKSVSTKKFSWCRVVMGIFSLDCSSRKFHSPSMTSKQQVGKC